MTQHGFNRPYRLKGLNMKAAPSLNTLRKSKLLVFWPLQREVIPRPRVSEVNLRDLVRFSCKIRMRRVTLTWSNTRISLHTISRRRQWCALKSATLWVSCPRGIIEIANLSCPLSILIRTGATTITKGQHSNRALTKNNHLVGVILRSSSRT
jgi:hypothetical protein